MASPSYKISVWHGEGKSLFYVLRGGTVVKTFHRRDEAEKYIAGKTKNPRAVTLNEAKRVLPKNRLTDVLVKSGGKVFKAKAKYDPKLGRVRVFANPRVARKINPAATQKYWSVQGHYGHGWEEVTAEEWKHGTDSGRKEAIKRVKEYRENEPGVPFRVVLKREKVNPEHPGDYKDSVLAQVGHLTHKAKTVAGARKWIKGMYSRGLAFGRTAIIWKYDGKTGQTNKVFEKNY